MSIRINKRSTKSSHFQPSSSPIHSITQWTLFSFEWTGLLQVVPNLVILWYWLHYLLLLFSRQGQGFLTPWLEFLFYAGTHQSWIPFQIQTFPLSSMLLHVEKQDFLHVLYNCLRFNYHRRVFWVTSLLSLTYEIFWDDDPVLMEGKAIFTTFTASTSSLTKSSQSFTGTLSLLPESDFTPHHLIVYHSMYHCPSSAHSTHSLIFENFVLTFN